MATAAVLVATQHMLRYLVTGGGSEGDDFVDVTQSQLILDCAAGPLKELFTSPLTQPPPGPGVAAWTNLQSDGRLSVMINGFGAGFSTDNSYEFLGSPNRLHIVVGANSTSIVELRFDHSAVR